MTSFAGLEMMLLPEPDPFLLYVQAILRGCHRTLHEAEWKRVRQLWLDGETDPLSIVLRVRQDRLWER